MHRISFTLSLVFGYCFLLYKTPCHHIIVINNTDLLSQTRLDVYSGKGGLSCIQKPFNPITCIPVVFYKGKQIF